jgi:hypothetical protein
MWSYRSFFAAAHTHTTRDLDGLDRTASTDKSYQWASY